MIKKPVRRTNRSVHLRA